MIPSPLRAALDLGPSDRESWITHFLDDRGTGESRSFAGIRFPLLSRGESVVDLLAGSYAELERLPGSRDRLRSSVVNILRTECDHWSVQNANNVLGRLLAVVRRCGFVETEDKLAGWIRANAYPDELCSERGKSVTLRSLIWLALLTWDTKKEWLPFLERDIRHPDCGALCFRAIGNLDPGAALRRIPAILTLEAPYVRILIFDLIESLGIEGALDARMASSWQRCLSTIERDDRFGPVLDKRLIEPNLSPMKTTAPFLKALEANGIFVQRAENGKITLQSVNSPTTLVVSLPALTSKQILVVARLRAARVRDDFSNTPEELAAMYSPGPSPHAQKETVGAEYDN